MHPSLNSAIRRSKSMIRLMSIPSRGAQNPRNILQAKQTKKSDIFAESPGDKKDYSYISIDQKISSEF